MWWHVTKGRAHAPDFCGVRVRCLQATLGANVSTNQSRPCDQPAGRLPRGFVTELILTAYRATISCRTSRQGPWSIYWALAHPLFRLFLAHQHSLAILVRSSLLARLGGLFSQTHSLSGLLPSCAGDPRSSRFRVTPFTHPILTFPTVHNSLYVPKTLRLYLQILL
jgi:hypothetical protein